MDQNLEEPLKQAKLKRETSRQGAQRNQFFGFYINFIRIHCTTQFEYDVPRAKMILPLSTFYIVR